MVEEHSNPAGQSVQKCCPPGEYVPETQAILTSDDVEVHMKPGGQATQVEEGEFVYVPGLHASSVADVVEGQ